MSHKMDELLSSDPHLTREPRLDITSRAFQPRRFIQKSLADVSHRMFEQELVADVDYASRNTEETLKQLIRDNLGTFIESKDAMDHVYSTDEALFSGEALEGITAAFEAAEEAFARLIEPTVESYMEVQRSKKSNDMLERLYSVLSVPGSLYEACGVRVARRQVQEKKRGAAAAAAKPANGQGSKTTAAAPAARVVSPSSPEGAKSVRSRKQATWNGDCDAEESDEVYPDGSDNDGERCQQQQRVGEGEADPNDLFSIAGALEAPATRRDVSRFMISPDEEVFYWYGTALVRIKDRGAQRHHVEEVSNYESAGLMLRRAMLYLEENYNLEEGTILGTEDTEEAISRSGDGSSSNPLSNKKTSGKNVSAISRSVFVLEFSAALLRAALYLEQQLSNELVLANAADTVLIEDTLSAMMDASIATVKLHHFCKVLQQQQQQKGVGGETAAGPGGMAEGASSTSGQGQQRRSSGKEKSGKVKTSVSEDDEDDTKRVRLGATGRGLSEILGRESSFVSASTIAEAALAAALQAQDRKAVAGENLGNTHPDVAEHWALRFMHPAHFFIRITRKEHAKLVHTSAKILLQDAIEWQSKMSRTAQQRRQGACEEVAGAAVAGSGDDKAKTTDSDRKLENDSLRFTFDMGTEGKIVLGNITDSFVGTGIFGSSGAGGAGSASSAPTRAAHDAEEDCFVSFAGPSSIGVGNLIVDVDVRESLGDIENQTLKVLEAFRTPEADFDVFTTFSIGDMDMTAVLSSSCVQIRMHAASMLQQLLERTETEAAVMTQGGQLATFAAGLADICVSHLEHVTVSYWGGIAAAIHAGAFDFYPEPDTVLARMLKELQQEEQSPQQQQGMLDGNANETSAGDVSQNQHQQRAGEGAASSVSITTQHARTLSAALSSAAASANTSFAEQSGGSGGGANVSRDELSVGCRTPLTGPASATTKFGAKLLFNGGAGPSVVVPPIKYIPVLPELLKTYTASISPQHATALTLRDISVQAVRRLVKSAGAIIHSLFLAFVNRCVVTAFVRTMSQYTVSDAYSSQHDERVELHAAVLVEVILAQWEGIMAQISASVLRMKIAIGESCSTATVASDLQVEDVGELIEELEKLRTSCFRCFLHGTGMLTKAYITMLPMMQQAGAGSASAEAEYGIRARLSRDYVSSYLPSKLLNMLAVALDRTLPFLRRRTEVYESPDLFAARAEEYEPEDIRAIMLAGGGGGVDGGNIGPSRKRVVRRRRGEASGSAITTTSTVRPNISAAPIVTETDPVTQFVADCHSRLVREHIREHEELLQALVSGLLLVFVDVLHLKCQAVCADPQLAMEEREHSMVECMADALCLPTTVAPMLLEDLLEPCLFDVIAELTPEAASSTERLALTEIKKQSFNLLYLTRVGEHCQLVLDSMMSMYLAIPQQHIAREVRQAGFAEPSFDWQRASAHTAGAVRPYIADAIVYIARARETLNAIHQPVLGAAVTQQLVAHLATTLVAAITADVNAFELSLECSHGFLVYGTLLIEAEVCTVLSVVDTVIDSVTHNQEAGDVLPGLLLARARLLAATKTLAEIGNVVCQTLSPCFPGVSAVSSATTAGRTAPMTGRAQGSEGVLLTPQGRAAKRQLLVADAMEDLRYMVEAINTHLAETSLARSSFQQFSAHSAATESIVERISKRKEGYQMRHQAGKKAKPDTKSQQQQQPANSKTKPQDKEAAAAGTSGKTGASASKPDGGKKDRARSKPPLAPSGSSLKVDAPAAASPTLPTEWEEDKNTATVAATLFQHNNTAGEGPAAAGTVKTRRKVRISRKTVEKNDDGDSGRTASQSNASAPAVVESNSPAPEPEVTHVEALPRRSAARELRRTLRSQKDTPLDMGNDGDEEDAPAAPPMTSFVQPPRRNSMQAANTNADSDEGGGLRRERRVHRFRRSNAL